MSWSSVDIGDGQLQIGRGAPLALIAGPCVLESPELAMEVAAHMKSLTDRIGMPYVFKASFDKANRTSLSSFRGPGLLQGLETLGRIRHDIGVPVITDIHSPDQAVAAAEVVDIIQIPAFLCRQTDLLVAAAETGKPVNIKKGQFLAPWDMKNALDKVARSGNDRVVVTERGSMFGYNNLVVDFRGIRVIHDLGYPIIFDATHSIQLPGGEGGRSGGQREYAPMLARAAVAAGVDGVFMEVHPDPDRALCDGPNSLALDTLEPILRQLQAVSRAVSDHTETP